jgi:hypothetical protein
MADTPFPVLPVSPYAPAKYGVLTVVSVVPSVALILTLSHSHRYLSVALVVPGVVDQPSSVIVELVAGAVVELVTWKYEVIPAKDEPVSPVSPYAPTTTFDVSLVEAVAPVEVTKVIVSYRQRYLFVVDSVIVVTSSVHDVGAVVLLVDTA